MTNDPYHKARDSFRILGPIMMVIGGLMLIIGVGQLLLTMIQAMNAGPATPPILFLVLGMPGLLIFGIGMQLTGVGFLKQASKYAAKETTPAAQIAATAIRSAIQDDDIPCPSCSTPIPADSKFCSHCGAEISDTRCPSCDAEIEADSRFCNECGHAIKADA